jgi:hypothetical protein
MLRVVKHKSHGVVPILFSDSRARGIPLTQQRGIAIFVARVLRSALKIRYLVLGGAAAGGVSLHQVRNNILSINHY